MESKGWPLTFSIGVLACTDHPKTVDEILQLTAELRDFVKNNGRLFNIWMKVESRFYFGQLYTSTMNFNLGMVTDAVWADFDQDGWEDLLIAREWNSMAILKNTLPRISCTATLLP